MLHVRVSVHLPSLGLPFKQALATAARLQADAVEIDGRGEITPGAMNRTAIRHIRKMLEDLNLRIASVQFRTRNGYDAADGLERRIDATKAAMQMAYELGAKVVVNHIGEIPGSSDSPAWNHLIGSLSDIGRHGQRTGAMLAAHPGENTPQSLLNLLEALPEASLGVDFDPAALILAGHNAPAAMQLLGPHVLNLRGVDAVRDASRGRGVVTQLGRGSAGFPELLGVLERHTYNGFITVESGGEAGAEVETGAAIEYLRRL